jgi:prolyl oligopeptidase
LRDGRGVLYSQFARPSSNNQTGYDTEKLHYCALYYHKMGTPQEEDVLLYKIDKYPYHTLTAYLSSDATTLYVEVDEGHGAAENYVYGFVDVGALGPDWMEKPLPEPTWLTKLDFSESLNIIRTDGKIALATTNIGAKSGEDSRVIKIDLQKP